MKPTPLGLLMVWLAFYAACQTPTQPEKLFSLPSAAPEKVGVSQAGLDIMDSLFQVYIQTEQVPAVGAMMIREDQVIYHAAFGQRIVETQEALEKDDIFRVASMTKPVTVVAALILLDEGKIQLDDPIERYLPAFASARVIETFSEADTSYTSVPAQQPITIRHLMTHTSGIGYPFIQPQAAMLYYPQGVVDGFTTDSLRVAQTVDAIATQPLLHQPGQQFTYGLSIDVLGRLVEVVSGQDLATFMDERIFTPLGMDDTGFYLPAEKAHRLVKVYVPQEGGGLLALTNDANGFPADFPITGAQTYYSGGAGLSATVEDYARFALMLENGGILNGKRILQSSSVDLMSSNHLDPAYFGDNQFGLGVSVHEPRPTALHPDLAGRFGWGGYFKTRYWSDPSEDLVIVMMCQMGPGGEAADEMMDKAMEAAYAALKIK